MFISYTHDDEAHKRRVLDLAGRLRKPGNIEVVLDRYVEEKIQDWALWAEKEIPQCDIVLVIATPKFVRKYNLKEPGYAAWECKIIRELAVTRLKPVVAAYMEAKHADPRERILGLDGHYPIHTSAGEARLLSVLRGEPTVPKPEVGRGEPVPAAPARRLAGRAQSASGGTGARPPGQASERAPWRAADGSPVDVLTVARRAIAVCDRDHGYAPVLRTLRKLVEGIKPAPTSTEVAVDEQWLAWIANASAYDHAYLIWKATERDREAYRGSHEETIRGHIRDDARVMRRLCFELLPVLPGPTGAPGDEQDAPTACTRRLAELAAAALRLRPAEFRFCKARRDLFSPWEIPPQGDFGIDADHEWLVNGLARHIGIVFGGRRAGSAPDGLGSRLSPDALGVLLGRLKVWTEGRRPGEREPLFYILEGSQEHATDADLRGLAERIRAELPGLDTILVPGGVSDLAPQASDEDYTLEARLRDLIMTWEEFDP